VAAKLTLDTVVFRCMFRALVPSQIFGIAEGSIAIRTPVTARLLRIVFFRMVSREGTVSTTKALRTDSWKTYLKPALVSKASEHTLCESRRKKSQMKVRAAAARDVRLETLLAFVVGNATPVPSRPARFSETRLSSASEPGFPRTRRLLVELPRDGVVADRLFRSNLLLSSDHGVSC
jgi:hypothetical protein